MTKPEPGSLAARSDLRNRLSFFRKRANRASTAKRADVVERGGGAGGVDKRSSVGEVTITIEDESHVVARGTRPPKASPLPDCDSGASSSSPSMTVSPTSSPAPLSSANHSPAVGNVIQKRGKDVVSSAKQSRIFGRKRAWYRRRGG